ncbi:MAG TPA: proline/glycine betaine ABC transporter permease [Limnochordales bacterium]|nr:proline/glycine betaine ABC transporter permease [Limnochordales bacterium]
MEFVRLPLGNWMNAVVDWLVDNLAPVFRAVRHVISTFLNGTEDFLQWLPWPVVILAVALLMGRVGGWRGALLSAAGLYLVGAMHLWDRAMTTLALMVTSVTLAVAIGVPVGILCARSDRVQAVVRPILDMMQTMPAFVYLVPALMFFGIGKVPAVFATLVFATPPAVRLTNLGIRQVAKEVVEATQSFGATPWQMLVKVQLPLAMPSIMAGINQTIMLSLSMSVLSAMIAAGGLGQEVLRGLSQVNLGRSFEGGLAIVVIAMILDRMSQTWGQRRRAA